MSKRRRGTAWIAFPFLGLALAWSCGGPQELAADSEVCYRDDDCVPGLVCVAAPDSLEDRRCTSDVSGLISTVPGAPPPMMPAGGAPPSGGGGAPPGAAGTPAPPAGGTPGLLDAGMPDAPGAGGA